MLRGAVSIWGRDMLVLRRSFIGEMIAVIAYPITLYLSFGFGLNGYISNVEGVPYTVFIAPGLISMTAVNAAFDESSWSMWFHRRVQKTIEEYRVNPIDVYDIVIGKIMSGFTQAVIKGLAVTAVILLLTPLRFGLLNLIEYLAFIILGCMMFSCLGTACGTVIDKPASIGKLQSVVLIPLIFMSGIFFPLSSFPPAIRHLVHFLPTTAIFEGARQALIFGKVDLFFLLYLGICALLSFLAAVFTFNRRIDV